MYADPYTATMTGFAKVRNFLWENLVVPETRPKEEIAEILLNDPDNIIVPGLMFDRDENEPDFELICCVSACCYKLMSAIHILSTYYMYI